MTNTPIHYRNMMAIRATNPSKKTWKGADEVKKLTTKKSGGYGEIVARDMVTEAGYTMLTGKDYTRINLTPLEQRCLRKNYYTSDGYIVELDAHIESKMLLPNTSGTANDILDGFLRKVKRYGKKSNLLVGGEFELDTYSESNAIQAGAGLLNTEMTNFYADDMTALETARLIKEGKLEVVKLSEFPMWLATQKTKELAAK